MDVTVYLPDELGARAKEEKINLSGTLRAAVKTELGRREKVRKAVGDLGKPKEFKVRVVENDKEHTGRITGWAIDHNNDWDVYLTADDRVIVYNEFRSSYDAMTLDEARAGLDATLFPDALSFLGVEPIVDL